MSLLWWDMIFGVEGLVELVRVPILWGISLVGDPHIYFFILFLYTNGEVQKALCKVRGSAGQSK